MTRIMLTLPKKVETIIEKKLMALMGSTKAEICRNIILSYLSEKGYIKTETNIKKA